MLQISSTVVDGGGGCCGGRMVACHLTNESDCAGIEETSGSWLDISTSKRCNTHVALGQEGQLIEACCGVPITILNDAKSLIH